MKLLNKPVGFIINFNVPILRRNCQEGLMIFLFSVSPCLRGE